MTDIYEVTWEDKKKHPHVKTPIDERFPKSSKLQQLLGWLRVWVKRVLRNLKREANFFPPNNSLCDWGQEREKLLCWLKVRNLKSEKSPFLLRQRQTQKFSLELLVSVNCLIIFPRPQ